MEIALFGGGFKPFTKGHYAVIQMAAKGSDILQLYVSEGDRARKGEFPIYWKDMKGLWDKVFTKILPQNVKTSYVPSPVGAMMELLYDVNDTQDSSNQYVIYSDATDMKRFDNPKTRERLSFLWDQNLIRLVPLPRLMGASGTKTRKYLELGLVDEFTNELPEPLQANGHRIFKLLGGEEA